MLQFHLHVVMSLLNLYWAFTSESLKRHLPACKCRAKWQCLCKGTLDNPLACIPWQPGFPGMEEHVTSSPLRVIMPSSQSLSLSTVIWQRKWYYCTPFPCCGHRWFLWQHSSCHCLSQESANSRNQLQLLITRLFQSCCWNGRGRRGLGKVGTHNQG